MFYVVYNSVTDQYLNDDGGFGHYDDAAQFGSRDDAQWWALDELDGDEFKIVGPCKEGEEP